MPVAIQPKGGSRWLWKVPYEVPGRSYAGHPTGFRRMTPGLLKADRTAESFAGLPDSATMPGQLLAALKAAAPGWGFRPAWCTRSTGCSGSPSRRTGAGEGGRSSGRRPRCSRKRSGCRHRQVKAINRALIEAGLITMKDSPNGKRYGHRDPKGRITEAYGFDLSPIAMRHAEFVRLAEEARAERAEIGRLRRRATIARKSIAQIIETVAEYGFQGEEWVTLTTRDPRPQPRLLRKVERPEEMTLATGCGFFRRSDLA